MGRRKVEVHPWSSKAHAWALVQERLGAEAAVWARELFRLGLHPDGYSRPRDEFADPVLFRSKLPVEVRRSIMADIVCCVLERKFPGVEFTGMDAVLLKVTVGVTNLANPNVDGFEKRRKMWDAALQRARKERKRERLTGAVEELSPETAIEILAENYLRSRADQELENRGRLVRRVEATRQEVIETLQELLAAVSRERPVYQYSAAYHRSLRATLTALRRLK